MSVDDATIAAVFRAALTLGIAKPADLLPWADGQIMTRGTVPEWILDVSLAGADSSARLIAQLEDEAFGVDAVRVFRLIVGLVDLGTQRWEFPQCGEAARWISRVAHGIAVSTAVLNDVSWLEDEYDLGSDG